MTTFRSTSVRLLHRSAACWCPALAGFAQAQSPTAFDSTKAWEHLRQQVAIGPRPSGSPGNVKNRDYIKAQMAALGIKTAEQPFDGATPLGPIKMVNLIATIPGKSPDRIVLASHFDTKLFRDVRFVGASDGASSTAALIELARVHQGARPAAVHDRVAVPRRRRSGRRVAGHRQHLRQPPLRRRGAQVGLAEIAARADPARHDRRSQPDHPPRVELDALAHRHRLGRREEARSPRSSWTKRRPSRTITCRS